MSSDTLELVLALMFVTGIVGVLLAAVFDVTKED